LTCLFHISAVAVELLKFDHNYEPDLQTDMETQRHRDIYRHTETHKDTQIHTQTHKDTQRDTHRHTYTHKIYRVSKHVSWLKNIDQKRSIYIQKRTRNK